MATRKYVTKASTAEMVNAQDAAYEPMRNNQTRETGHQWAAFGDVGASTPRQEEIEADVNLQAKMEP